MDIYETLARKAADAGISRERTTILDCLAEILVRDFLTAEGRPWSDVLPTDYDRARDAAEALTQATERRAQAEEYSLAAA